MKKETSEDSPWKGVLAKDVDEYLTLVPDDARFTHHKLRETIRSAAPEVTEAIYYRIPTFILNGPLVAFSARETTAACT